MESVKGRRGVHETKDGKLFPPVALNCRPNTPDCFSQPVEITRGRLAQALGLSLADYRPVGTRTAPLEQPVMSKISSIQVNTTSESRRLIRPSETSREDLVKEFSKLLQSITTELSNQTQDMVIGMDISIPELPKKKVERKEAETIPDQDPVQKDTIRKDECPKEVVVSKESPKKEEAKIARTESEEKPVVEGEVSQAEPEEAGKESKPAENKEEVEEAAKPVDEKAEGEPVALKTEQPTVVVLPSAPQQKTDEQTAAPAEEASEAAAGESGNNQTQDAAVEAKPADDQETEANLKQQSEENSGNVTTEVPQEAEQASDETQSSQTVTKNAKTKTSVLPEASPQVKNAEKALEKALAATEKTAAAIALETTNAMQNAAVLKAGEARGKLSSSLSSQQFVMQFMRELSSISPVQGMSTHSVSLPGLASIKMMPEQSNSSSVRQNAALPRATQTQTISRIEDALREVSKSADGKTVSLRLDPPELGTVKIEVTYKEGTLSAKIVSESSQVTTLIREKAFELQAMLRKLGLSAERIVVQVGQEQSSGQEAAGQSFSNQTGPQRDEQQSSSAGFTELFREPIETATIAGAMQTDDHWVA